MNLPHHRSQKAKRWHARLSKPIALAAGAITAVATFLAAVQTIGKFFGLPDPPNPISEIFGPRVCYPFEPLRDRSDKSQASRHCLPGRLTYVKWIDESDYPAVDRQTGRWPNDKANRILTVLEVDPNGTPVWGELNLLRVEGNQITWQRKSVGGWTEIVGNSPDVVEGQIGALLRRQDPDQGCSASHPRHLLETFLPLNLSDLLEKDHEVKMCYRWMDFDDCADSTPLKLSPKNLPFSICVGPVVRAAKDR